MADDLNADKILASLNNTDTNVLYRWLQTNPQAGGLTDALDSDEFIALIHQVERTRVTAPQRQIIVGRTNEPLLLVQGPPGTGKSYTIGWAILYRMLNAAAQGRPFRVAVACNRHNAINIVLDSIAKKAAKLAGFRFKGITTKFQVVKLVNDTGDDVPNGVRPCLSNSKKDINSVFSEQWGVVGGTPGGLYNAAKNCSQGGFSSRLGLQAVRSCRY